MWLFQLAFLLIVGVFKIIGFIFNTLVALFSDEKSTMDSSSYGGPTKSVVENNIVDTIAGTMTVGAYCALGDGNLDNRELETLRRWKKEFVSKIGDSVQSRVSSAMELEINSSLTGVTEQRLHSACSRLKELGEPFKTMTMGLAFEIVAADQKIESSELACLHKIARLLDISDTKFKDLEEKHLRPIQLKEATSGQSNATANEQILGINPSWTTEQKLAKLTSEFSKYNARMQTIRNDEQRAQCRRMLEIIAAMREELTTGRKPSAINQTPSASPSNASGPVIPAPVASKDEKLVGISPTSSPREKLLKLDEEQNRWETRMKNNLTPTALAKCEEALQAIRRLRNLYTTQI
jgi:uncharacterized tellurite resistance protein B-like protein